MQKNKIILKVAGFSFVKNAIKFDYPVVESIKSILPICDKFFIAVGKSEDNTLEIIKSIDSKKIEIIETVWDETLRKNGKVLSEETNKAFNLIPKEYDWAFYIQADEVVHEKYLDTILKEMNKWLGNKNVDGLLFDYNHFYGSYEYVGTGSAWYDKEIRVIRNNKNIYSYFDAQGFRKDNNKKLNVKYINAKIFHYGYVREPLKMGQKNAAIWKYWQPDDEKFNSAKENVKEFDYSSRPAIITKYKDTQPIVLTERIKNKNWDYSPKAFQDVPIKDKIKLFLRKYLGINLGYKNYKIIK